MKPLLIGGIIILILSIIIWSIPNKNSTSPETNRLNEIFYHISDTYGNGSVSFKKNNCTESEDCDNPTEDQKDAFITNCLKIGGKTIDTDLLNNPAMRVIAEECSLPIQTQLVKYEPSNHLFYDYRITITHQYLNPIINDDLLRKLNMFATNYTIWSNGSTSLNVANLVGTQEIYKIKLEDKDNLSDSKYEIIPDN